MYFARVFSCENALGLGFSVSFIICFVSWVKCYHSWGLRSLVVSISWSSAFDVVVEIKLSEMLKCKFRFNSFTVFLLEQILYNIKQEYKRMQKRRHLENSFQQTDPCCSTDAQPHAFLLTGPALPGNQSILCNFGVRSQILRK